jgi:hypothetical protein
VGTFSASYVASAQASGSASVTVRVLGQANGYQTLTPPTTVTTTTTPATKDGGSCSGTSAAGALELATKGEWEGTWSPKYSDYEVTSIDGRSFPFEEGSLANYYWSFWLNNQYEEVGVCEAQLEPGDQALFVPSCFGASCPDAATQLLGIEGPATAEVGTPVTLTVRAYPAAGGAPSPAKAMIVSSGSGGPTALANAEGQATLTFSAAGSYTLRAAGHSGEEPAAIPGEASVCVHQGNDGTCGTSSGASRTSAPATTPSQSYAGPYALVAQIGAIRDGAVYTAKDAPRELTGSVSSRASVTSISLRLRRTYHGRCWAYSGTGARLDHVRCREGSYFKVASGGDSFSYLLPSRLPPGRYVLDIRATDSAGNHTALARGSSRVVFYVR